MSPAPQGLSVKCLTTFISRADPCPVGELWRRWPPMGNLAISLLEFSEGSRLDPPSLIILRLMEGLTVFILTCRIYYIGVPYGHLTSIWPSFQKKSISISGQFSSIHVDSWIQNRIKNIKIIINNTLKLLITLTVKYTNKIERVLLCILYLMKRSIWN